MTPRVSGQRDKNQRNQTSPPVLKICNNSQMQGRGGSGKIAQTNFSGTHFKLRRLGWGTPFGKEIFESSNECACRRGPTAHNGGREGGIGYHRGSQGRRPPAASHTEPSLDPIKNLFRDPQNNALGALHCDHRRDCQMPMCSSWVLPQKKHEGSICVSVAYLSKCFRFNNPTVV